MGEAHGLSKKGEWRIMDEKEKYDDTPYTMQEAIAEAQP